MRLLLLILLPWAAAAQQGTLAYIADGDVWAKELPAGAPRRLTSGGGHHGPRWSASGQWLSYWGGKQLWVMRAAGSDARTLDCRAAAWSPAADTLACLTPGGSLRVDEKEAASGVESFAWSPDGQRLAYVRSQGHALWRVGADGSDATELYRPDAALTLAGWTADGEDILFWLPREDSASLLADGVPLAAIRAGGGKPRLLSPEMLLYADFWAASSAGRWLAIAEGYFREAWHSKRIVVVDLATGERSRWSDLKVAAFSPSWSPDGKRLAFVAAPESYEGGGAPAKAAMARRRIWVAGSDGTEARRLTDDVRYRDERPQWATDGNGILFARLDDGGQASLWMMRADGGGLQQVANISAPSNWFGYYGHMDWGESFDWLRRNATASR